ncbi:MAG: hypothetical protein ACRD0U_14510 [Acidimicrobiales bacterium]
MPREPFSGVFCKDLRSSELDAVGEEASELDRGSKMLRASVVAMSVALLFAACGDDDDDGAGTTTTTESTTTTTEPQTTTTSSTTTTTPPSPEQQAIAAYNRYWQVFLEASAIPDPNYPSLGEVATGGQLARLQTPASAVRGPGASRRGPGLVDHRCGVEFA